MKISLLTLTGARPEAFALCEKYILRQKALTMDADWQFEWIIIDDCHPATEVKTKFHHNLEVKHIRNPEFWSPHRNSFYSNLELGLKNCCGELIAFIEDDDWYSADYLLLMLNVHKTWNIKPAIIGSTESTYYNVRTREYSHLENGSHASLCETIIHRSLLPLCEELIKTPAGFFDLRLWEAATAAGLPIWLQRSGGFCVGIKGMPGRPGIGVGHLEHPEWRRDNIELDVLKNLIGAEDAENYKGLYGTE